MLSGKTVTALLLSITAVGLFAVTGYNLRHGPVLPEPVAVSESSELFPELETPVTPDAEHPLDLNMATAEELMRLPGIGEVWPNGSSPTGRRPADFPIRKSF